MVNRRARLIYKKACFLGGVWKAHGHDRWRSTVVPVPGKKFPFIFNKNSKDSALTYRRRRRQVGEFIVKIR